MRCSSKTGNALIFVLGILAGCFMKPGLGLSAVCDDGRGEPPFLSYGSEIKPNLLLMIDNSASMYDLAYDDLDEPGFCNDDSYIYPDTVTAWASGTSYTAGSVVSVSCTNADHETAVNWFRTQNGGISDGTLCTDEATCGDSYCSIQGESGVTDWDKVPRSYAGYFEASSWYEWDSANNDFAPIAIPATPDAACSGNATDIQYTNSDVCVVIRETAAVDEEGNPKTVKSVVDFAASGNFLNWASASKFDIEKKILTGGKFTGVAADSNVTLTAESRGCLNRRMVRQVQMVKTADSTQYYLSLAIEAKNAGSDWNTTLEIFEPTENGFQFNNTACKEAIEATQLGQTQNLAGDCLMIGKQNESFENSNAAFNNGFQTCWGYPTVGVGDVIRMKNACAHVYDANVDPKTIDTEDSGYVCMGDSSDGSGYVGRCITGYTPAEDPGCHNEPCAALTTPLQNDTEKCDWEDATHTSLVLWQCPLGYKYNEIKGGCSWGNEVVAWQFKQDCQAPTGKWVGGEEIDADVIVVNGVTYNCIEQAIRGYCADYYDPGVPDPIGPVETIAEDHFPNLPAILTHVALNAQLGDPLATYDVRIHADTEPSGLLQQKRDNGKLRLGLMTFNSPDSGDTAEGTKYECDNYLDAANPGSRRLYNCTGSNQDGGKLLDIIADDAEVSGHFDDIISKINDITAKTWTPYAEAYFGALGYYTQDSSKWLDTIDALPSPDPVCYWCQDNNVLILTDGSSTADRNQSMENFVAGLAGVTNTGVCGDFDGSSYLDDLTGFAWTAAASTLYGSNDQLGGHDKNNIKTYIVTTGTLRDTGTGNECSPTVLLPDAATSGGTSLFAGEDAEALEENLNQILSGMEERASAGSAASVISSSRGGEGAVYQAIFWPGLTPQSGPSISWAGEVHALMIDSRGYLYEDTDGDRTLNTAVDKRVIIYFDEEAHETKACFPALNADGSYLPMNADGSCPAASTQKDLDQVRFLWSANDWLAKVSNSGFLPYGADDIYQNRSTYISNSRQRYIFTWEDLNNDGRVSSSEVLDFTDSTRGGLGNHLQDDLTAWNRGKVVKDLNAADSTEADAIIDWVRGAEQATMRSRTISWDVNRDGSDEDIVWRLGDTINSTPTAITRPSEGLQYLYRDTTYAAFANRWQNRRHMIYFGGNDGMLHAINGGFFNDGRKKFRKCDYLYDSTCPDDPEDPSDVEDSGSYPELGAEMWAYVPYNLLPHLKCLTSPDYADPGAHKYYVDQRPRVFDAQIFDEEYECTHPTGSWGNYQDPACIHPHGWGTVLVGAMRFGGAKASAMFLNGYWNDHRVFTSSYFLMDITDPEHPPVLLSEMTMRPSFDADMGYTVPVPTVVTMIENGSDINNRTTSDWYLMLGSGPTDLRGQSSQLPRLAVVPLKQLVRTASTTSPHAFRIPPALPSSFANEWGSFTVGSANGFISDLITVDFDLDPNYDSDAVYFGTVEGSFASSWSGKSYRLVTRKMHYDADGKPDYQLVTSPHEWAGLLPSNPKLLIDAQKPIVSAATVGTDGDNFWVYFGTGRFYDTEDKSQTDQQGYFGIKEPLDEDGEFTWDTVEMAANADNNGSTDPGNLGLLDVSEFMVSAASTPQDAALSCVGDYTDTSCLPHDKNGVLVDNFAALQAFISPDGDPDYIGTDGWYRDFVSNGERNLGQATLLGGLVTFTTYEPFLDPCLAEGLAYLYGLYYKTGTAWYNEIFSGSVMEPGHTIEVPILLGRGLATTPNIHVGQGDPTAFVQTSTGEIREVVQQNLPITNFKTGRTSWRPWPPR